MGVPVPTAAARRLSAQQGHPYTAVLPSNYDHRRDGTRDESSFMPAYGRDSPLVSSVGAATPPVVSNVRALGGEMVTREYDPQQEGEPPQSSKLWRILTCRCG